MQYKTDLTFQPNLCLEQRQETTPDLMVSDAPNAYSLKKCPLQKLPSVQGCSGTKMAAVAP